MSTVVYKNGIIAADTQVSVNDINVGTCTKIYHTEKHVIGAVGALMMFLEFKKFLAGEPYNEKLFEKNIDEDKLSCIYLVIDKSSKEVSIYTNHLIRQMIKADYYAIGSGSNFAYGAMAMGATAKEAVKIASQFCPFTNDIIESEFV